MPKVWAATIEEHRRQVRDAVLDATAQLVAEHGVTGVTMSQVAQTSGIGRATLYKHFPNLQSILTAWHERQVGRHLHELVEVGGRPGSAIERLEAVLSTFAASRGTRHGGDLAAALHQGDHLAQAEAHLRGFVAGLIAEATAAGAIRDDVDPEELAVFCLHAMGAAAASGSKAAAGRVVQVTLDALRRP